MTDPLSITGSVVGIISLGIQVAQGLFDYYMSMKTQYSNVAYTIQKLEHLLGILEILQRQVSARKSRADEQDLLRNIESSVSHCEESIEELRDEANKFKENHTHGIRAVAGTTVRRVAYPFRQSTLQKLDEDIDDIVAHLSLALQLLQQDDTCHVQDDIEDAKAMLSLVRSSQILSNICEWLKAPDATINFNEACNKRHLRTGLWFVKDSSYTAWLQKPSSFLWLNGFAGCGKSVLSSTIIQHTFRYRRSNPQIGIAFFFFTFNDDGKQDASSMLRALVLQLSGQLDSENTPLSQLYKRYHGKTPPDQALTDCLHQIVQAFRDVFIIVDALDESPKDKHRAVVLQVLDDLRTWAEPSLHLLVTSRDEVDIRNMLNATLEETIVMRNEFIDRDIASFIRHHLRDNRRLRKWEEHYDRIESVLTERAMGMFRWVKCQFRALINCPASEDLLDQLLGSLPHTLDETYERMLGNISPILNSYARQMLLLLCCAKRPLTVSELTHGIAFELGEIPRFNSKRRLKNIDAIQEVCPGITEVDVNPETQSATIRIAHFSVQEYLESERIYQQDGAARFGVKKQDAHAQIACMCLTLLLEPDLVKLVLSVRSEEDCPDDSLQLQERFYKPRLFRKKGFQQFQKEYPLARYAATYWPDHYLESDQNPHLVDQVRQLLRDSGGSYLRMAFDIKLLHNSPGERKNSFPAL